MKTIERAFGEVIREARKSSHLSQEELAHLSGLDRSYISLLECGHKQPTLLTIFELAKALKTSPSSIIVEVENKTFYAHGSERATKQS